MEAQGSYEQTITVLITQLKPGQLYLRGLKVVCYYSYRLVVATLGLRVLLSLVQVWGLGLGRILRELKYAQAWQNSWVLSGLKIHKWPVVNDYPTSCRILIESRFAPKGQTLLLQIAGVGRRRLPRNKRLPRTDYQPIHYTAAA